MLKWVALFIGAVVALIAIANGYNGFISGVLVGGAIVWGWKDDIIVYLANKHVEATAQSLLKKASVEAQMNRLENITRGFKPQPPTTAKAAPSKVVPSRRDALGTPITPACAAPIVAAAAAPVVMAKAEAQESVEEPDFSAPPMYLTPGDLRE
jgi:hypothetical protein